MINMNIKLHLYNFLHAIKIRKCGIRLMVIDVESDVLVDRSSLAFSSKLLRKLGFESSLKMDGK